MNIKSIGKGVGIAVVLLVIVIVVAVVNSHGSTNAAPVVDKDAAFSVLAKQHFADIQSTIPELSDIHCLDSVCSTVVYFNFKTTPTDIEAIIRGNAVTFSNLRAQTYGIGSAVTVFAQLSGKDFFHCNAVDGQVTECANN